MVTLPRRLTAGVVEDCLSHGVWVFTEKPLLLNKASAPRILSKIGNRGVCVGLMKRCDASVIRAKEMVDQKRTRLGPLQSVAATCHAGDSYFGIGGDFKSVHDRPVVSALEAFPAELPADLHHTYEQFLNVYSHTLNLSEYLSGGHAELETGVHDQNGAGHFTGRIGSVPYVLSVSRGTDHPWIESVELRFEKAVVNVKLPAAFDKNGSAVVECCAVPEMKLAPRTTTSGAWAFDAQPERFHDLIVGKLSPVEDVVSSWRYAESAERLFSSRTSAPP